MQTEDLIALDKICSSHNLETSFIDSLQQYGLVEITTIEKTTFIPAIELQKLEQMIRLHYELDINLEGIDAIRNLLQRIEDMQHEIFLLKSKLYRYESPGIENYSVSNQ